MSLRFQIFYRILKILGPKGNLTIEQIRQKSAKLMSFFPAASDVEFSRFMIGALPAAWVHAPGSKRDQVILFFHGGGYTAGSIETHQDLLGRISKSSGLDVLAIDYRLAPENPFPAALEDALAAYQFLLDQKITPDHIFVAGSSCGGALVLSLFFKLRDAKKTLPKAGICLCPWVDLAFTGSTLQTNEGKDLVHTARIQNAAKLYLQGHDSRDPYASPLYGDLKGLPPLLVQAGTREILLDEIKRLVQKAKDCGVSLDFQRFDGMIHTWQLYASKIPEGQQAIEKIGDFIRKRAT